MPTRDLIALAGGVAFSGVVLTGGRSRRMGCDKATLVPPSGGPPLAARARHALGEAGASECLAIGGDAAALAPMGLRVVPDCWPGEGPLGATICALHAVQHELAMVLSCDMPAIDAGTVRVVVAALAASDGADAAIPRVGGRLQPTVAAYRASCAPALQSAFERGARSLLDAVQAMRVAEVSGLRAEQLRDVDRPGDLDHYAQHDD